MMVLLAIVVGLVMVFTNPTYEAHQRVGTTATPAARSGVLGRIAADLLEKDEAVSLKYNNYYVFSTTTLNGKLQSVGAFTRVWKCNRESIKAKVSQVRAGISISQGHGEPRLPRLRFKQEVLNVQVVRSEFDANSCTNVKGLLFA